MVTVTSHALTFRPTNFEGASSGIICQLGGRTRKIKRELAVFKKDLRDSPDTAKLKNEPRRDLNYLIVLTTHNAGENPNPPFYKGGDSYRTP